MTRTELDNGLQLLVHPTTSAPLAAIYLWIDAGTVDEAPGMEGSAHFLEHMLFKGTHRRGVGEAAAEIEALGGDLNAFTSHEETVIHATVEAGGFSQALDVVADMALESRLDATEHERERQVVLEEIRSYEADPDAVLEDATLRHLYPNHPYGRPVLGTPSSVRRIGPDDLRAFHGRCYGPRRAVLAVAGDVDPRRVQAEVQRALGGWEGSSRPRSATAMAKPTSGGLCTVARDFETPAVELAWPGPPLLHADVAALDVLAHTLGVGAAAWLVTRLQHEQELVHDVWTHWSPRTQGSTFSVGFQPRQGRTAAALAATLKELERVRRCGPTAACVARARDGLLADMLFQHETVDGIAQDLAWYQARHGDPAARDNYRAAVAAVDTPRVREVAQHWLSPRQCTAAVLERRPDAKSLEAALRTPQSRTRAPKGRTKAQRHVFDNGARLWVLPDDSPVVAVHAAAVGGGLREQPRTAGTGAAWAEMLTAGAGSLDPTAFAEALDGVAGTMVGRATRSTVGVTATFPAPHAVDGLGLFGMVLEEPWFDDEEWARAREELLEHLATRPDRPAEVAGDLAWERCWPRHPWRLPAHGRPTTISRIGVKRLRRWHAQHAQGPNVVVAVAGGIEPEQVLDAVGPYLEGLPEGDRSPPQPVAARPPRGGLRRARAGREQALVQVTYPGLSIDDPDRVALAVGAAMLDGQAGRLFMNLREQRALTYAVGADAAFEVGGGLFSVSAATEPSRATEAKAALLEELDRLWQAPPSDDEIARYRRMLTGHLAMALQSAAGRALDKANSERLGLASGYAARRTALESIGAEDVHRAFRRILDRPPTTILVDPERT